MQTGLQCLSLAATLRAAGLSGVTDVVRPLLPEGYTYWDYQRLKFPRNEGIRIDFILGSHALAAAVTGAAIHRDERKGEQPSDHVPVVVEFDLGGADDAVAVDVRAQTVNDGRVKGGGARDAVGVASGDPAVGVEVAN